MFASKQICPGKIRGIMLLILGVFCLLFGLPARSLQAATVLQDETQPEAKVIPVAQQTLEQVPGYESYQKVQRLRRSAGREGRVSGVQWSSDGKYLAYQVGGVKQFFDLKAGEKTAESFEGEQRDSRPDSLPIAPVGRAEQRTWVISPDARWKAIYHDFNVYLEPYSKDAEDTVQAGEKKNDYQPSNEAVRVTRQGDVKTRYGTCCWVYGEELDQQDAMWWSPDGSKLAFYEVAETHMKDYHLSVKNVEVYPRLETTRYPTAGEANPYVALLIYDVESGKTVRVQVEGPEDQYLYNIGFTADSQHLKFHRTNRWQNDLDVMLANVETGESRSIVNEQQETWQENSPTMRFLKDGQQFVWQTERSGFAAYELRDIAGERLAALSPEGADFPVGPILELDESAGWLYYSAFSGGNPYNAQIYRSRLDGSKIEQLTAADLSFSSLSVSPDHQYFVVVGETAAQAPTSFLYKMGSQEPVAVLAESNGKVEKENNLQSPELFHFTADDGKTEIWGVLYKPTNFDPARKYPLVIDVYGGPHSGAFSNRYGAGNPGCEFGFVIAKIGNRGTVGRGKAFESANYMRLGVPDLDDQVAGVRYLSQRDYIDSQRVGIYGHSYGGYMTALALLKYPEVFHVGVSGAPVTHWKNYDTIYTERYMRTPQVNEEGYEAGSCMKFASQLQGRLMLVHGLMDDNVHPSNTWQLVDALYKADKRFDMLIYPGFRHGVGSTYPQIRWEYLVRHLQPVAE